MPRPGPAFALTCLGLHSLAPRLAFAFALAGRWLAVSTCPPPLSSPAAPLHPASRSQVCQLRTNGSPPSLGSASLSEKSVSEGSVAQSASPRLHRRRLGRETVQRLGGEPPREWTDRAGRCTGDAPEIHGRYTDRAGSSAVTLEELATLSQDVVRHHAPRCYAVRPEYRQERTRSGSRVEYLASPAQRRSPTEIEPRMPDGTGGACGMCMSNTSRRLPSAGLRTEMEPRMPLRQRRLMTARMAEW